MEFNVNFPWVAKSVKNPCRYCTPETGRHVKCHIDCREFAIFKEEIAIKKAIVRNHKVFNDYRYDRIVKREHKQCRKSK